MELDYKDHETLIKLKNPDECNWNSLIHRGVHPNKGIIARGLYPVEDFNFDDIVAQDLKMVWKVGG